MNAQAAANGMETDSTVSTDSSLEFGDRRSFVLLALAALLLAAGIRWEAQARIQGPLIADSIEYITMARHATEGASLAVKPVRSGFFPLMLAVPLYLQEYFTGEAGSVHGVGTEDPSIALSVLLLFNLLSIFGTYRLGRLLRGPWTGLLAAFFVSILPEFTRWSMDYLTDIPAAAFGLWALVYWVERKPFRVGLMLGLAVAVRYQCLIPLGAFFLVPLLLRRWKDLFLMFMGLLPAMAILGAVDFYYWGEAFHTLMLFVPRQLTTFLPAELVAKFFPIGPSGALPAVEVNQAVEAIVAKDKLWYLDQSAALFSRTLLYPILLFPLARRSLRSRSGADMTLWITAFTLLVLSVQRYKEPRYLVAIVPMLAVLSSIGVMWVVDQVTRKLGRTTPLATSVGAVLLLGVGAAYSEACQTIQRRMQLKPFGSYANAVDSIPVVCRPSSIAMERRWLVSENHPIRATGGLSWFSNDFATLELEFAVPYFQADPATWEQLPLYEFLKQIDYFVIPAPSTRGEMLRQRWLNQNTLFDGYFYELGENEVASLRLRSGFIDENRAPFWNCHDERARQGDALAMFETNVEFVSVEVEALPTSPTAVRIDTRWRLPVFDGARITAVINVLDSKGRRVANFPIWLIPHDDYGHVERSGVALRETNYVNLLAMPADGQLDIGVRVFTVTEKSADPLPQKLELPGSEEVWEKGAAQYRQIVPIQPSQPLWQPPASTELDSKNSG